MDYSLARLRGNFWRMLEICVISILEFEHRVKCLSGLGGGMESGCNEYEASDNTGL